MVDALGVFVPYSQTLSSDAAFDAYHKVHESGSHHARVYASKRSAEHLRSGPATDLTANPRSPARASETLPWSGTRTT